MLEGLLPNFIYLEDGCRKCLDIGEWEARIFVYSTVNKRAVQDRFFIEGDTKANENYIDCYSPLENLPQFQIIRDGSVDLHFLVEKFHSIILDFFETKPDIAPNVVGIDFLFTWLTCHTFSVRLKSGESFLVHVEHPLNSNKDTDLVIQFIRNIRFDTPISGAFSAKIDYITLQECQKELDISLCRQGRSGLL